MLFARCIFGVYLRALCYAKLVDTRDQKEKKNENDKWKKKAGEPRKRGSV